MFSFRVAQKREDAVSKEVTRKLSEADNRKMSRKEKDERLDVRVCVHVCIRMCMHYKAEDGVSYFFLHSPPCSFSC